MERISAPPLPEKSRALRATLAGGTLAGVLDLSAAFVNGAFNGVSPVRVTQAIASGLLGAESYKGGAATVFLGILLHFFIALTATAVYYSASRRFSFLINQPLISGALYGIAVYLLMTFIVLPLSSFTGKMPTAFFPIAVGLVIHILFVGLPIALAVRRFAK